MNNSEISQKRRRPKLKLYWCSAPCHCEDWFVIGRSLVSARRWFEDFNGFDRGEADAQYLCDAPAQLQHDGDFRYGPSALLEDADALRACGVRFLNAEVPMVAEFEGRRFVQGMFPELLSPQ